MKEHSEEIIPIKRDQNFKETYNEILRRIRKLKIVELRAVGRAVGTAISLSEKIASESKCSVKFQTKSTTSALQLRSSLERKIGKRYSVRFA